MSVKEKLIFFTNTYPYGVGELWKKNELDEFAKYFQEINVIPFSYGNNRNSPKKLPQGVEITKPLFEDEGIIIRRVDVIKILFNRHTLLFLAEFFRKKVYKNKKHIVSWMLTTLNIIRLLKHPLIKRLNKETQKTNNTILYFFWGKGSSDILPFINTGNYRQILVRMHRFDLFEYANDHYIPYRSMLMRKKEVLIAPCSEAGKKHLFELYPDEKEHIQVVRLGTKGSDKKSWVSTDGILRVISCSNLTAVKRVYLMIESIKHINVPIIWHHIGSGPLEEELKLKVEELGLQDRFIFDGFIDTEKINHIYTSQAFDLFVNTSSSEGVPVSIMEAFAAGIPVIATDVGGTSEIVDDTVGALLPENLSSKLLANTIINYYKKTEQEKEVIRNNAYTRYKERSNVEVLTKELINILKKK